MALGYLAAPPRVAVAEPQLGGRTLRFELDTIPASAVASDYALSPDGLHVAWTDIAGVHLRALDALEKQTLAAHSPGSGKSAMHALTWSPDGKTIAYSTADELWRVDIAGGTPVRVSEGESFWTGPNILAWSPDDRLVMATTEGLISVPAAGGTVAPFELPELEDTSHYDGLAWSSEGDLLLVRHREATVRPDTLSLYSDGKLVDLTTLVGWVISSIDFTSDAVWLVRESDGDKSIWRIPYSSQTKSLTGEPELVRSGATGVSVDGHGTAVHVLEQGRPETEMVWIDHEGQVEPFGRKFDGEFVSLSLSHDERQVLANNFVSGSSIWSYDLDRGITAPLHEFDQLTVTAGGTLPDGRLLGTSFDDFVTYAYPLDGRGEREPIVEGLLAKINDEGSFAVVFVGPRSGAPKLKTFELGTKNELLELRDSVSPQGAPPDISHDGRWLVFCTNRSGQANVALTRFPSGEGEWFVSVDGGSNAWFETDDSAIYFQRGGSRLGAPLEIWRVSFACEPAVRLGAPEQLFQIDDEFEVFEYHAPTRRFVGTRRRALAERRIVVETDVR